MFDSVAELLEKIRLGEDSHLELKEVRLSADRVVAPARESLAQELVAFANTKGGVCVLGVDDQAREAQGLTPQQLDIVETYVREICFGQIAPALTPIITRLSMPRADGATGAVLKVDVERSLFVHSVGGVYYHRIGSSKRPMSQELLARLLQQRSQARIIRYDEQSVPQTTMGDLAQELWERFKTPRTQDIPEEMLQKLGMLTRDEDGTLRPTIAGVLMASHTPERWLSNAFIQAVAYVGTDAIPSSPGAVYQLDAKDITGPLDYQVIEACRFVARNTVTAAAKDQGRLDLPQYDMTAVFEAIVNAVAHRDYSIYGSKVRLRLFADRLEIYSPGAIPNTMTVDSLPYRQSARNEVITSLLAKVSVPTGTEWIQTDRRTMMDKRGEGVSIILANSEKLSGRTPIYQLRDDSELQLTIFAANYSTHQ